MARLGKVSACMFCGEQPCVCNKPAKKEPASKPQVQAAPVVTAAAPVSSQPDPWAQSSRKPGPFAGFVHPTTALAAREGKPDEHVEKLREESASRAVQQSESDVEMKRALEVIRDAGILAPESQARVERLAPRTYPDDALAKKNTWKERNGVS